MWKCLAVESEAHVVFLYRMCVLRLPRTCTIIWLQDITICVRILVFGSPPVTWVDVLPVDILTSLKLQYVQRE